MGESPVHTNPQATQVFNKFEKLKSCLGHLAFSASPCRFRTMKSNATNWDGKGDQKENGDPFDWVEFSSDDSSGDDASVGWVPAKQAQKKTNGAKAATKVPGRGGTRKASAKEVRAKAASKTSKAPVRGRKNEGKIPRKALGNHAQGFKFGAGAGHIRRGVIRSKSPEGKTMVLSRRLSRRIMKGSPLRSPICACQLNFSSSAMKERKPKSKKKGTRARVGAPTRATL